MSYLNDDEIFNSSIVQFDVEKNKNQNIFLCMVPLGRSTCGLLFLTDVSESSNPTTSRAQSEGESCKLGPELEQLKYKSLELLVQALAYSGGLCSCW